ncbi:tetratricopeptide repeat (TPR)-like superfamily protein [Actinidia rufa]|uniref:Tetratricopeptide repeat (TPR)-like superfamily protein n=1 Tax=Actinidia rufa TaxID=165716 RepID=A0A7J0GKR0_9ERIC|nr:tetratricopeptide repeat (TPR)-like superfamily protein [Actinidia rufa]
MVYISALKIPPKISYGISRISNPTSPTSLYFFCSSSSPNPFPNPIEEATIHRTPRGKHRNPEKLEDLICRMMANRPGTTRLQNSIRKPVPEFDHSLVYNVLHGARNSEHGLQSSAWAPVFRWVERTGLFQHDRETHYKIIEIFGRASKLNHAWCILLDMSKKGVEWDEDMFVTLIDSYGSEGIVHESEDFSENGGIGTWEEAEKFFVEMKGRNIAPTVISYTTMIKGFVSVGRVDDIGTTQKDSELGVICGTQRSDKAEHNCWSDKVKNSHKSCYTNGETLKDEGVSMATTSTRNDDALRLLEDMKSYDIKPNAVTYSTLLPGLCDAEKMPEAQNFLKEMVKNYIAPKDNGIFVRLLSGQCKAGNLDAAVDMLKAMIRLINLLDKLIEKDIILRPQNTLEMEPSAYNPMITYLCSNGQTGKAEFFFRQLMKRGVQDSIAFNNIICGHSTEGTPDSAFEILKIMIRRKVPAEGCAYKLLIESYLKKGEPADAKTTLDSMIETRGSYGRSLGRIELLMHSGCTPHYDKLLSVLCENGKTIAALKLLEFCMERDFSVDFSSYDKMLEFCMERDFSVDFSSYDKVLDALLAVGKTYNAYSMLCKITEKGGVTDQKRCQELIKSLNKEGNTKQADILSRIIGGKR